MQYTVYTHEFINTIFDLPLPDAEAGVCLTRKSEDGKWHNFIADERRLRQFKDGQAPWYFCVSTIVRPGDGEYPRRGREALCEAYCVVLDDIGTAENSKVGEPAVAPSWKLESSPGNFQWGYLIVAEDMTDPERLAYYEGCVKALGVAGYGDPGAGGSYRVMRVPGSLHKTGFVARVTKWKPEKVWALEDLMAAFGLEAEAIQPRPVLESGGARDIDDPVFDWLAAEGLLTGNQDSKFHEVLCPWRDEHESGGDTAGYTPVGHDHEAYDGAFSCMHDHCKLRGKADFSAWVANNGGPGVGPAPAELEAELTEVQEALLRAVRANISEDSAAQFMASVLEGRFQYAHGHGWHQWDGTCWQPDQLGGVMEAVKQFTRKVNAAGQKTPAKLNFMRNVMTLMTTDSTFSRLYADYDRDNYLLCTPGGVVDLRTGVLREGRPSDMVSRQTNVTPGLSWRGAGRFTRFLDEITAGDTELAAFLQRALGAMLSGAVEEHWMMFWVGGGRNGKNTLGDLVQWILGSYATTVPAATLMAKKHEEHATEIMSLKARRMVVSSEVEDGAYWAESRLNQVTGDAVLTGRFMRQDFVTFERTHKHLVYGNHKPQLRNVTPAIMSRLKIVPFNVSFAGREDADLGGDLRREASAVLRWLIEGHAAWLAAGKKIGSCAAVDAECEEYFKAQSHFDLWLEECINVDENAKPDDVSTGWATGQLLYKNYQSWKLSRGEVAHTMTRFGAELSKRFSKIRTARGVAYVGLTIGASWDENMMKWPK